MRNLFTKVNFQKYLFPLLVVFILVSINTYILSNSSAKTKLKNELATTYVSQLTTLRNELSAITGWQTVAFQTSDAKTEYLAKRKVRQGIGQITSLQLKLVASSQNNNISSSFQSIDSKISELTSSLTYFNTHNIKANIDDAEEVQFRALYQLIDQQIQVLDKRIIKETLNSNDVFYSTVLIFVLIEVVMFIIVYIYLFNLIHKNLTAEKQLIESEKMAQLGHLVAGITHEVNTPLGVIVTAASHNEFETRKLITQVTSNTISSRVLNDYLNSMLESASLLTRNCDRASQLMTSFKNIAVNQSAERLQEFELHEAFRDVLNSLHHQFKSRPISININTTKPIQIQSYPGALSQIITNLLMNSLIHAFTKEQTGEIDISLTEQDNEVIIIYKNNGKSIPAEELSQLFQKFYTTKREQGGSGLGMYITHSLITKTLNGKISCTSQEGQGVEFIITLPLQLTNPKNTTI
ncbi:MAG: HAMP domain-containing histidine kinase [Alteromonadales bacterium]|nr:HAMP domain-containing histidine kinase [Alteromonadales bacterium]